MKKSILVVDDEPDIRGLLQEILEDEGYDVFCASTASQARAAVEEHVPDLVLLDIWMPDEDGVSLLKSWKHTGRLAFPVIMISGHGTVETAVEATRHGAVDFIEKPVSLAKLLLTVDKAFTERQDKDGVGTKPTTRLPQLVGDSVHMQNIRDQIEACAVHEQSVLIVGDAGTGKALLSQHMHSMTQSLTGRYVHLRCESLSAINAQRELFGQEERGVISVGYLESASHGTLFLADVDLMPPSAQKLLSQALEQRSFYRVGGSTRVACKLRTVSATRHPLANLVQQGTFDAALSRILGQQVIELKPLREHPEDVPALLENFVNWHVEEEGLPYRHFTVAAQNRLRNLDWPGNLLELKNLVQRILILGGATDVEVGEVDRTLGLVPGALSATDDIELRHDLPLREARTHFERAYLLRCLAEANGNIGELAKHVGMERTHLYRKLRSLDIDLDKVRE